MSNTTLTKDELIKRLTEEVDYWKTNTEEAISYSNESVSENIEIQKLYYSEIEKNTVLEYELLKLREFAIEQITAAKVLAYVNTLTEEQRNAIYAPYTSNSIIDSYEHEVDKLTNETKEQVYEHCLQTLREYHSEEKFSY